MTLCFCCLCLHLIFAPLQELRAGLELNFALNSKAFLIEHASDLVEFVGNRTECALLMLGRKWGADYKALRDQHSANIAHVGRYGLSHSACSVPGDRHNVCGFTTR